MKRVKSEHEHYWNWHHGVIDGKKPGEVRIVRSCSDCKLRQMAVIPASAWKRAKGDYALDEHYR